MTADQDEIARFGVIPELIAVPSVQYPVLPQGIHDADVAAIEAAFVEAHDPAARRREVFDGWMAFRLLLTSIVPVQAEYVDGSFVTGKPNPKDVDIAFWILADDLNALPPEAKQALEVLMNAAKIFHVDAYIVPQCDAGHPSRPVFDKMLWTEHYWTRCRDTHGVLLPPHEARKGYLRVVTP